MKKRNLLTFIIATIAMFVLALSLVACRNVSHENYDELWNNDNSTKYDGSDNTNNDINGNTGDNNSHNNNNENTDTFFEIWGRPSEFSDGVTFVEIAKYERKNGKEQFIANSEALINDIGDILFYNDYANHLDLQPYHNGVSVCLEGNTCVAVYDKNGNIVISPEKKNFDNIISYSSDNKYFIVDKTEEAFSGDTYMVGVIDCNGNYIQEMSKDNILAKFIQTSREEGLKVRVEYVEKDIFSIATRASNWSISEDFYYFHINNNIITKGYEHIEVEPYSFGLYKYDESGNYEILFDDKNVERVFEDAVLVYEFYDNYEEQQYLLLDYNGNILLDLSEYGVCKQSYVDSGESPFYFLNGYFLTQIENKTGGKYCCLFGPDGQFVFEPIRMENGDHFYKLTKNGFIYENENDDGTETFALYRYDGTIKELKYEPFYDTLIYGEAYTFANGPELTYLNGEYIYFNEQEEIVISASIINERNQ